MASTSLYNVITNALAESSISINSDVFGGDAKSRRRQRGAPPTTTTTAAPAVTMIPELVRESSTNSTGSDKENRNGAAADYTDEEACEKERDETVDPSCITNKGNDDGQKSAPVAVSGPQPPPVTDVEKKEGVIVTKVDPAAAAVAAPAVSSTDDIRPKPNRGEIRPNGRANNNPRENLRRSLLRRSHSLTAFEQNFLEDIATYGRDEDAAAASAVLQDDDLFFDVDDAQQNGATKTTAAGASSVDLPQVHPPDERAMRSASSQSAPDVLVRDAAKEDGLAGFGGGIGGGRGGVSRDDSLSSLDGCIGVGGLGSSRRRESTLKSRREQQSHGVHGGMWRAHDRGISTNGTISRGFLRRNSSAGMLPSGMGMSIAGTIPPPPGPPPSSPSAAARAAAQHRRERFRGVRGRSLSQSARDLTTLGNDEGAMMMSVPLPPPPLPKPFGRRGSMRSSRENLHGPGMMMMIPRPPSLRNLSRQSSANSVLSTTSASIGGGRSSSLGSVEEATAADLPIRYAEGSTAKAPAPIPPRTPTPTPPPQQKPDMVVTDATTGEAEIILDEDAPPLLSHHSRSSFSSQISQHNPIRRTLTPKISNVSDDISSRKSQRNNNADCSVHGGGGRIHPPVGHIGRHDSESSSLICATGTSTRSIDKDFSRGPPQKSGEEQGHGLLSSLACSADFSLVLSDSLSTFDSGTGNGNGTDGGDGMHVVESIDAEEFSRLPSRGVFVPGGERGGEGGGGGSIRILDDHHGHHDDQRMRAQEEEEELLPPRVLPQPPPQPKRVVSNASRHVQRPIMTRLRSRGDGIEILNNRTDFLRSILPTIPSPSTSPRDDHEGDDRGDGSPEGHAQVQVQVQVHKVPPTKTKTIHGGHSRRRSRSSLDLASGPIIFRSLSSDGLADMMLRSDSSLNVAAGGSVSCAARSVSSDAEVHGASTDVSFYEDLEDDDDEWDLHTESVMEEGDGHGRNYDPWQVLRDEYAVGYYGEDALPFRILGTSADDVSAHPHVLSPPLMESLQSFLPPAVSEGNFWLKYSLVRDGASLLKLLQRVRGSTHTILALETVDGEVFGSFTSIPWRKHHGYFGTGECFLWRMREPRSTPCHSITDQAQLESEIDVFPWMGENECNQVCRTDQIGLGGGELTKDGSEGQRLSRDMDIDEDGGFGLTIGPDLLYGSSSSCATFGNPCLSKVVKNGMPFEIVNLEVWALTPCVSEEEAEKLELMKLFLEDHGRD